MLLDDVFECKLTSNDREDVAACDELQIVQHTHAGRVGDGYSKGAPLALEREHHVLDGDVVGNELGDLGIDFKAGQIDRGHPVLACEHAGEVDFLDEAELHQVVADLGAVLALLIQRARELLLVDEALSEQHIAKPLSLYRSGRGGRGGWRCCWCYCSS